MKPKKGKKVIEGFFYSVKLKRKAWKFCSGIPTEVEENIPIDDEIKYRITIEVLK